MSGPLLVAALPQQAQAELANVYRALARGPLPGQPLLAVEPYLAVPTTYTVQFRGGLLIYCPTTPTPSVATSNLPGELVACTRKVPP